MIYAETFEAPIHETGEDLEPLELPSIKNYLEEGETSEPRFFFTQSRMQGTLEEPIKVIFFSDQEVSEARVTLPNEAKLLRDQLPAGLTAKQGARSHEWIMQTGRVRNTFVLPVVFDSVGNYEVAVEGATATIEVQEPEETSDEVPVEETESSDEDSAGQENLKEENVIEEDQENEQRAEDVREPVAEASQEQQTDEAIEEPTVFDGETSEVTTMAQFREAVANPDIGIISVQANLTDSAANILSVDRTLLIQGNGYTLTFGVDGGYFQLVEVMQASALRIENATLTKVGVTPLINTTVESSKNWTVELEDINEMNANTMQLASLPEGRIHFTGGVSNFTRTASTRTFIVAKEVLATNQAEVTINRGNATVFFSSSTVADPKLTVEQGATVTITTTAGVANTIDLRGENPEIAVQNGQLSIGTIGPATATTPTNMTNNAVVLSGVFPSVSVTRESIFELTSTLSKKGLYLAGDQASLNVQDSEFNVTTESQTALHLPRTNGTFQMQNTKAMIQTTTGTRVLMGNGTMTLLDSELNTSSTSGAGVIMATANGTTHLLLDNSKIFLPNSGNRGANGIRLEGRDTLLSVKNRSSIEISSSGSDGIEEQIGMGQNSATRVELLIEKDSNVSITAKGNSVSPTDTERNSIRLWGATPTVRVTNGSTLNIEVTEGSRRGLFLKGSNPSLSITESQLAVTTVSGQGMNLFGSNPILNLKNSQLNMNATTGSGINLNGITPQVLLDNSRVELNHTGAFRGIILSGSDALFSLSNQSEFKLTGSGTGTLDNIQIGNDNVRPRLSVTGGSKIFVTTTSGNEAASDTSNNAINLRGYNPQTQILDDSELNINILSGTRIGLALNGEDSKFEIHDSKFISRNRDPNTIGLTTKYNRDNVTFNNSVINFENSIALSQYWGGKVKITNGSKINAARWSFSSNEFLIEKGSEVNITSSQRINSLGLFGNSTTSENNLIIRDASLTVVRKDGTNNSALVMSGGNSLISVTENGKLYVENYGNTTPTDRYNNSAILFTSSNNNTINISDIGSSVNVKSHYGSAVSFNNGRSSNNGTIKVSNFGCFSASGKTATDNSGIFNGGMLNFEFDNPLYLNFTNFRSEGGEIFDVTHDSTLSAKNSNLALWTKGSDVTGSPSHNISTSDYSFRGLNMNTLVNTTKPEEMNTSIIGNIGLRSFARMSSNHAQWAIADELRVPTSADKKIYGRVSLPVGLDDSRPALDGEVTVTVEIKKISGESTQEYTAKTVGDTNESPGISIYGEEPRGGLFEINLDEPLEAGSKVRISKVELTSGELTDGFEHQILTDTVEVFPIIPPTPAKFSSSIIVQNSTTIQGVTDNLDAEVTATHNGEPLNTEAVTVQADGRFTLDLSEVSLEMDDEIQVFLRDAEGSAEAAGIINPPKTNNDRGNINPDTELTFHDVTFEPATTLIVGDTGPVSPVDPLDPEVEVNPENKPDLPEDQGPLSIDFVSSFNFGSQPITVNDQTYYAQPQRLLNADGTVNEIEERPNYVQISDRRPENDRNGWQLALTQNASFTATNNRELNGARLRLTNQQLATAQGGSAPEFQQTNPLALVPGNRRILLMAQGTEGTGTWIYRFGDKETANKSVALEVPKGATPEATRYETTLMWELSAVPDN